MLKFILKYVKFMNNINIQFINFFILLFYADIIILMIFYEKNNNGCFSIGLKKITNIFQKA